MVSIDLIFSKKQYPFMIRKNKISAKNAMADKMQTLTLSRE